jgi:signal transduction histidine kinase
VKVRISGEEILKQIKLPDYKGRHVFTAKLRLVIFAVFWILSAIYFKGIWRASPLIPLAISLAFLLTVICYNNILKSRALLSSFILEIMADLFSITLIVYMTGGERSQFFTIYIIYCVAAGTFYSNLVALIAAILSFVFYGSLVLLLYSGMVETFRYPAESLFFSGQSRWIFFLNLSLLAIFLPIVVYAAKITNYFSRIKERALEDRNKQLIALNRISSTIKGFFSLERAIRQVLSGVIEGLGYDICFLVMPSKKENVIFFHAPKNNPMTQKIETILGVPVSSLRLPPIEENFVFQAIKNNKITFRQELYEIVRGIEPPISRELAATLQRALGFKKFVITPLVAERKVVGALIGVTRHEFVDETSVDVLENFSNQAALTIESAQLFEELRQKNIDLEQANKIKSEFLAIMSHELRTPLTAVIGFSELLLEEVMGELNPEQKEYLREVVHNSEHLLHLINSILDLSKIESGKMELTVEPFNLAEAVLEVRKTILPLLKKKGLKFQVDMPMKLPIIEGDERKIRQILLNLLSNAIKFTPEGGSIVLEVRHSPNNKGLWLYSKIQNASVFESGYFRISIEDTGIGIKEKDLEEVFDPFSQVDSSYTRKYQGTGLGLALTKQFVEMHGGAIWVESEPQKGSRFTLLLPIRPPTSVNKEITKEMKEEEPVVSLL